ncbi:MAG TPA: pilus assembly protein TadG-related protein [Kiritimatiellia bacterium]|nr:pilus assembly protein TadG-related protein [Kiritimatiellia bacterium]
MNRGAANPRAGHTLIFAVMVLVVLAFAALWMFDLHKTLYVKQKSRNAGDAAALAAARWQGISLNVIGDLNVLQAVAILNGLSAGATNFPEAEAIADLQARLAYVGPMLGFAASQQAAKNNQVYVNPDYSRIIAEHAAEVRADYPMRYPVAPYQNTPSPPTAWDDYASMLEAVAVTGIAALPDNMRLYTDYASREHLLLNPDFYDAVASSDWCWFHFNAYGTLQSYRSWRDWPPLPLIREPEPMNAEIFGLGLRRATRLFDAAVLGPGAGAESAAELLAALGDAAGRTIPATVAAVSAQWMFYRDDAWAAWNTITGDGFPFRSTVRPEFDYVGADSAVRLESGIDRVTPGLSSDQITWSAAAKPLGSLEGPVRPNQYGLVLPAYDQVRLIPIDASTAPAPGSRPGWAEHIYFHVPEYVARGLGALEPGCWYCGQLDTWEQASFRQQGLDWLAENSSRCVEPGPGGGPGGGGRRGH